VVDPLRGRGGGVNPLTTNQIFFLIKSGCYNPKTGGEKHDKIRFRIFKTKKKKEKNGPTTKKHTLCY